MPKDNLRLQLRIAFSLDNINYLNDIQKDNQDLTFSEIINLIIGLSKKTYPKEEIQKLIDNRGNNG